MKRLSPLQSILLALPLMILLACVGGSAGGQSLIQSAVTPTPRPESTESRATPSIPPAPTPTSTPVLTPTPEIATPTPRAVSTSPASPTSSPPSSPIIRTAVARVQIGPNVDGSVADWAFADDRHGWIVTDNGVRATVDGGQTWHHLPGPPGQVTWLTFTSPKLGWAETSTGLFATTNGGQSWRAVPIKNAPVAPFTFVAVVDPRHWWIEAGPLDSRSLLRTTDGGNTWDPAKDPCWRGPDDPGGLFSFVSADLVWDMCGYGPSAGAQGKELYQSTDGGRHWRLVADTYSNGGLPHLPDSGYVSGLFFLDRVHGWLTHLRGNVIATSDGGLTWRVVPATQWGEGYFGRVQFLSPTRGYVWAREGSCAGLIQTLDGGATWTQVYPRSRPCGPGLDYVPLQFVDAQHGFASGTYIDPGAILATADAGDSWQQIASLPGQSVTSLRFTDAMHGWASAEDNSWNGVRTTFETVDGGHTWKPVASRDLGHFSVPLVTGQFGWKLEDPEVMVSVDGGQTWSAVPLGYRAVGLSGLPDGHAWVIIAQGCEARGCVQLIFSTADGKTWTRSDFGQAKDVIATWLTFVDDNRGWLLDDLGRLYRTVDGGQTWTQLW